MGMEEPEYIRDPILDAVDMRKLFVGGITFETTDEEFKNFMEKMSGGKVVDFVILRRNTEKKAHFGFCTFETSEQLDDLLLKREELYLDNRRLEVHRAMPKKAGRNPGEKNLRTKKLFIANYPITGTEDELKNYLNARHPPKYGKITKMVIIHKRDKDNKLTGENKGYGFFEVSREDLADKMAIQHAVFDFGGRKVEIRKQVERDNEDGGDYTGGYQDDTYNYKEPQNFGYGHPPPHHGPPPHHHHGPPPHHHGPPPHHHGPPPHHHGPPPPRHHVPPPPRHHGPPPPHHHGPPPPSHHAPPPPSHHAPPPPSHHAPPPHSHGPSQSHYQPTPYSNGPPGQYQHPQHYNAPPDSQTHVPPQGSYGQPPQSSQGPPNTKYGPGSNRGRGASGSPHRGRGYGVPTRGRGYGAAPPPGPDCSVCAGGGRYAPY